MTGRITHEATRHDRHGCEGMPEPSAYVPGTIWECDDCHQEWVVVRGSQYNETYYAWRKLTERNREGYDT